MAGGKEKALETLVEALETLVEALETLMGGHMLEGVDHISLRAFHMVLGREHSTLVLGTSLGVVGRDHTGHSLIVVPVEEVASPQVICVPDTGFQGSS